MYEGSSGPLSGEWVYPRGGVWLGRDLRGGGWGQCEAVGAWLYLTGCPLNVRPGRRYGSLKPSKLLKKMVNAVEFEPATY